MSHPWRTRATAHLLGDDVPHDGGIMTRAMMQARVVDPELLIPHLFEEHSPGFMARVKPGDFLVAGRNFGCGKPHTNGYIALRALGIRVLCESAPANVARSTMNLGLACLVRCEGVTQVVGDGDDIEVDFETGVMVNHSTGQSHHYPPLGPHERALIEQGGQQGFLRHFLAAHPELAQPWPEDAASSVPEPVASAARKIGSIPIVQGTR
jgi:3-isopropylmalate/(R)-2-methylmalate dehydratase small subunit